MPDPRPHVLIAGVSTRALAESAARAGYRVTAVDAFGDADLRAVAAVLTLSDQVDTPYSAGLAAEVSRGSDAGLAAYTSSFENDVRAVEALARGRRLLGNAPAVLERVRNPLTLMQALAARGFAVPATRASAPPPRLDSRRWLLKSRHSGGGHGVSVWRRGRPVDRRAYLQERIAGVPGSVIFAADGRRAVTLGLTRQLVGVAAFGARGFRYCGSLLASRASALFEHQAELLERAAALASAAAEAFALRGVNTVDFIAQRGVPFPIEVNPRYSASMELVERATGTSMFALHVQASDGCLPAAPGTADRVFGKAIVFARRDTVAPELGRRTAIGNGERTSAQVRPANLTSADGIAGPLADIPHPGERIRRGRPICTVFASEPDAVQCTAALAAVAAAIHRAAASSAGSGVRRGAA